MRSKSEKMFGFNRTRPTDELCPLIKQISLGFTNACYCSPNLKKIKIYPLLPFVQVPESEVLPFENATQPVDHLIEKPLSRGGSLKNKKWLNFDYLRYILDNLSIWPALIEWYFKRRLSDWFIYPWGHFRRRKSSHPHASINTSSFIFHPLVKVSLHETRSISCFWQLTLRIFVVYLLRSRAIYANISLSKLNNCRPDILIDLVLLSVIWLPNENSWLF